MNLTREKIESVNLNTGLTKITEAEKRKMKNEESPRDLWTRRTTYEYGSLRK